ncbi:MAG: RNA chaperone Hfq [Nitrospirae bacterium]|nr:RNA chaperone Hfq [Nitrospirota bacterium]
MGNSSLSLQDSFLNKARQENLIVTVHLTNGLKLEGKVRGFDNFTLILNNSGREHLVYKHAVSTIIPFKQGNSFNQNRPSYPEKKKLEALAEKYSKK